MSRGAAVRMRPVRLLGWVVAVNVTALTVAVGLTPAAGAVTAFAAWCSLG